MTKEEVENAMEHYWPLVEGKPISKDWPKHLIVSWGIEETATGFYELYVLGQNVKTFSTLKKTLQQWLVDNDS